MRPSISKLACLVLAGIASSVFAGQEAVLTAGPVSGTAPFEVDFRATVSGPNEGTRMFCTLTFGDLVDGATARTKFVLEGPWPTEAFFTHTYRYAGSFRPGLACEGSGTVGNSVDVTIVGQSNNSAPGFSVAVSPAAGGVQVSRTFTVHDVVDSDGDELRCFIDFDVLEDRDFRDVETVIPFTLNPPYGSRSFVHAYDVAGNYTPRVFCTDGRGGAGDVKRSLTVTAVAGNAPPSVSLDRFFPAVSEPGESRRYRIRGSDTGGGTLRCQFRGDSSADRVWFSIPPPYNAVDLYHTYRAHGEVRAYASCVDSGGAMTSVNRGSEIADFAAGNAFPTVFDFDVTPGSSTVPPDVEAHFRISAWDADGDTVSCTVGYGEGEGSSVLQLPVDAQGTPQFTPHTYARRGSYGATLDCGDGELLADREYSWIHLFEPGKRFPDVRLGATPTLGGGLLPVSLTLEASDPDGDPLDCRFRYGVPYAGGGVLPADRVFRMEPPYTPIELEEIYRGTHQPRLTCVDPTGRPAADDVWIQINGFNQPPTIESFSPAKTATIEDSLLARFAVRLFDTNLDRTLTCNLDFGDGWTWPNLRFQYPDYLPVNLTHLYRASATPYQATLRCDDGKGGVAEAQKTVEVGIAANRPPEIDAIPIPAFGPGPLRTKFLFSVYDVNAAEGDDSSCILEFDEGGRFAQVDPSSTVVVEYIYQDVGVYRPRMTCTDSFGAATTRLLRVVVTQNGGDLQRSVPVDVNDQP